MYLYCICVICAHVIILLYNIFTSTYITHFCLQNCWKCRRVLHSETALCTPLTRYFCTCGPPDSFNELFSSGLSHYQAVVTHCLDILAYCTILSSLEALVYENVWKVAVYGMLKPPGLPPELLKYASSPFRCLTIQWLNFLAFSACCMYSATCFTVGWSSLFALSSICS